LKEERKNGVRNIYHGKEKVTSPNKDRSYWKVEKATTPKKDRS
jgi:hypothetical protein